MPFTKECPVCGVTFMAQYPSRITRACSRSCGQRARRRAPLKTRLLKHTKTSDKNKCWDWVGSRNQGGYGIVKVDDVVTRAHRAMYNAHAGEIPEGFLVLHTCDNPPCINPEHLFLGTHQDNMDDMVAKGRGRAVRGTLHYGTHLTEADVRIIRRRARAGENQGEIAANYNISNSTVSNIKTGKNWGWLT